MAKRYDQMIPLIHALKPSRIVEVGVHRAMRAARLCAAAMEYGEVSYIGYDVFDQQTPEFQEAALNGKGMPSQGMARVRLNNLGKLLSHSFVIGDTRKTLHGRKIEADFAFIDGDHRVDAIAGDYEALSGVQCVVFDDYYTRDEKGQMPDTTKYGANQVVDRLIAEGRRAEVLPVGDVCAHTGLSHLAVVWV